MQPSNTIKQLEEMLTDVINNDFEYGRTPVNGFIRSLGFDERTPQSTIALLEFFIKAENEINSIKNKSSIDRYREQVKYLFTRLTNTDMWKENGLGIVKEEVTPLLLTLDSLSTFYDLEKSSIYFGDNFLGKVIEELDSLLEQIVNSELSKDLQRFLIDRIEEILKAIRRYKIDGNEGLEKILKATIGDLVVNEPKIEVEEKRKPIYKRFQSWLIALLIYVAPSPYDIIGAAPDIHEYWIPRIEELVSNVNAIEETITDESTIQEVCEKASYIITRQSRKLIEGQEPKLLEPAKEDLESNSDDAVDS